jgi:hypothetical protein
MINEILLKGNKIDIYSNKATKDIVELIKSKFSKYKIERKLKNELDYFIGLIELESLINKESFEKCFEEARTELFDYWDNLSYQERNRLVLLQTNVLKNNSHFFKYNNKPIWIAFFDELLNSLYNNEIAILELPQYFKLYRQFTDRMISVKDYGLQPFLNEYIPIINLVHNNEAMVFYYHLTKSIYYINSEYKLIRYALSKDLCQVQPLKDDLKLIATSILSQEPMQIIDSLLSSILINEKVKKHLLKYKLKVEKNNK